MLKNARTLQLAWFTTGAETATPRRLFEQMFDRESDAFQRLQPPQVPFPITVQAFVEDGVEHKLQTYSGRVDYIVSGVQQSPELPILPSTPDIYLEKALKVVTLGAGLIGNINRAGVIVTLAEKIDNLREGAKFFSQLFGGLVNFEDQSDFQFQMNSKLKGVLGPTDLNRLTRWTCDSVQFQQILNFPGAPGPTIAGELVDLFYLNYVIDINTVPSSALHPPSEHNAIFKALTSSALELTRISTIQDI